MVLKAIAQRRSIREYAPTAVSDAQVDELLRAAQFAPSAQNSRTTDFIVVREQAAKDAIAGIMEKPFLKDAPVIIIPASGAKDIFYVQDIAIASENIFVQAAELGIGTLWKHVAPEQAIKIRALLGIPDDKKIVNLIPVGYPKEKTVPHGDADFDRKRIHADRW